MFQGRLLPKLKRDVAEELDQPYIQYLKAIEAPLERFTAGPIEPAKARHVAHAMAGFVSGFLSFVMIGLESDEIESSLLPLRQAFVAGVQALLAGPSQTAGALPGLPRPMAAVI